MSFTVKCHCPFRNPMRWMKDSNEKNSWWPFSSRAQIQGYFQVLQVEFCKILAFFNFKHRLIFQAKNQIQYLIIK